MEIGRNFEMHDQCWHRNCKAWLRGHDPSRTAWTARALVATSAVSAAPRGARHERLQLADSIPPRRLKFA